MSLSNGTYDVLREAGLVPALTCAGCGNKISATVVPWPGDGYVTHPNNRCSAAALMHMTPDGSEVMAPFPSADPLPGTEA